MNWLFVGTAISFGITVFCLWLTIHAAVMNPALRPHLVATPQRMLVFSLLRFLTTGFVIYGLWRTVGWLAGIGSFFVIDYIRHKMLKHYRLAAAVELKDFLLQDHQQADEATKAAIAQLAFDEINNRIRGGS
jgi:hypothetical protein